MNTEAAWSVERDSDAIVWLTIDKPGTSANVLSSAVLMELDALLQPLAQHPPRAVIVLSGKKSGFVAGADIKEFTGIVNAEEGYRLIHAGQAGAGPPRGPALCDGRGNSWIRARWRPGAGTRMPVSRRGCTMSSSRSDCRKCSLASTRDSVEPCDPCGSSAYVPPWR